MKALLIAGTACLLATCGNASGAPAASPTSSTVYVEFGSGKSAVYLVSDTLDLSSLRDATNTLEPWTQVSKLPDGAAQVCKYTASQGINYTVWTTGSPDSTDLARAQCQRMGQ